MIKLRQLLFMFAALCVLTLAGCSKDDDASPVNKAALLTSGEWELYESVEDGETYEEEGLTFMFDEDGTYMIHYLDESESGTWELTRNNGYLEFDGIEELKIKKLDSKNLHLYDEDDEYEIRFKK